MPSKIEKINNDIISYFKDKKIKDYETLQKQIYIFWKEHMNHIKLSHIKNIINSYYTFTPKFNKNNNNNFREIAIEMECDEITNDDIVVPIKYQPNYKQFTKLYNIEQPEQKSKEWHDYRKNRITASVCATAINENPYETLESFILAKCDPNHPFRDSTLTKHGVKYEQIATMLYEHVYNVIITEFGCLPSEKESFLGASPDGICSKSTLNGKFCKLLGKMLEIKCPLVRKFVTSGNVRGQICPNYYFWQVQQQLYCCNLDVCDFWQCDIVEYKSREEFLFDNKFNPVITYGIDGTKINFDKNLCRGCILELYPINFVPRWTKEDVINDKFSWEVNGYEEADCPYFQAEYIYPPRLYTTLKEWDDWLNNMYMNWKELYPKFANKFYIHRTIYYSIPRSHNVEIKKDEKLFKKAIPILKNTMDTINKCKKNPKLLKKLKEIKKAKSRFKCNFKKHGYKYLKYSIANNHLIKSKKDFLKRVEIETPFI